MTVTVLELVLFEATAKRGAKAGRAWSDLSSHSILKWLLLSSQGFAHASNKKLAKRSLCL